MALTTIDGVIAGMRPPNDLLKVLAAIEAVGVFQSLFYEPGSPGAALAPTGLNGTALTAYAGQIPFTNPSAGQETRLARFGAAASQPGRLMLCDRLWHNGSIVVGTLTAQAITHPGIPARDNNGATLGDGVMLALEVSTAGTQASAITNTTASYTDEAGNAGMTATMTSFPATPARGTFVPFNLAAGDKGVRSVQSITLGTAYTGAVLHLVQYRKLASVDITAAGIGDWVDAVSSGFPRLYDNTVPFLVWMPATTAANQTISGEVIWSQG